MAGERNRRRAHDRRTLLAVTLSLLATLALPLFAVAPASADWPQFRHDAQHTGRADVNAAIQSPFERFSFQASGPVLTSPAVADVGGQPLIFLGSYPGIGQAGTLYALTATGTVAWSRTPLGSTGGYVSSPTVAQLDGAGDPELVISSLDDSTLRVLNARTGTPLWSATIGSAGSDLIGSSAVVADLLPNVAGNEIVLGGSRGDQPGSLLIYDKAGTRRASIALDGPSWSTPLVADIDADGHDEIVIGTGIPETIRMLFPSAKAGGNSLYAFERDAGTSWQVKWQATLSGATIASPAMGDLDGDGAVELVIGAEGGTFTMIDGATGAVEGTVTGLSDIVSVSSPTVVDIDADGTLEAVVGEWDGVRAFHWTGTALAEEHRFKLPQVPTGTPTTADPWVAASVAVTDIDLDGDLDVVAMTIPVLVDTEDVLNSDAYPGVVFAFDGADFSYPSGLLWETTLPSDGGIAGPVVADLDGDGLGEVIAGEGIPLIGDGRRLHVYGAANPIVRTLHADPDTPTDLESVALSATVTDEDTPAGSLGYAWALGDGTTATTPSVTHTYADDGTYTVTLTVTDPDGHAWTESRDLEVLNVAPQAAPTVDTTPGSLAVTFAANADDADGTVTSIAWELGDATSASGTAPAHTYATGGTYVATVTVTDDDGAQTTQPLVVDVNRFPTLTGPTSASVAEGDTLSLTLDGSDPDGDALAVASITGAAGATATVGPTGEVSFAWTPAFDQAGSHTVTVGIVDAGTPSGTASHALTIDVANTDRAPVLDPVSSRNAREEVELTFLVTAQDPDGDAVALTSPDLPAGATLTDHGDGTATFAWTPATGSSGTYAVTFVASALGLEDTASTTIVVREENLVPEISAPTTVQVHPGDEVTVTATVTDPDGPLPVAFSVSHEPTVFPAPTVEVSGTSGTWSWTPPTSHTTNVVLTWRADDGEDVGTVQTVVDMLLPPRARSLAPVDEASGLVTDLLVAGGPATLRADANDPDGTLEIARFHPDGVGGPTEPVDATRVGPYWVATHTFATPGERTVVFEAVDDDGLSVTTARTVQVVTNAPPVVDAGLDQAGNATGPDGLDLTLAGTASDPEGRTLEASAYTWHLPASAGGASTLTGPTVQATLPVGTHVVTLAVTDPNGATGTDTVQLVVDDTITATVTLDGARGEPGGLWVVDDPSVYVGGTMTGEVLVLDDLGTPVSGAWVNGTVSYHGTDINPVGVPTASFSGTTGPDGVLAFTYEHDVPGVVQGLGHHVIDVTASAPSRDEAPVADTEHAADRLAYFVRPA